MVVGNILFIVYNKNMKPDNGRIVDYVVMTGNIRTVDGCEF